MKSHTAGVILSGGKNSRMNGANKAFIEIGGVTMMQRAMDVFKGLFDEIILVTNSPSEYAMFSGDCLIVSDKIKNIGPLGGIHSALSVMSRKSAFFIAVDMPFLHKDLISRQIAEFEKIEARAFLPKIGASIEPLHAIYKKELREEIEAYIGTGRDYSIKGFLKTVDTAYFELEDNPFNRRAFMNLNSPRDIQDFEQTFAMLE